MKVTNLQDGGGNYPLSGIMRNAIINGDMRIDQRNSDTTPIAADSNGEYGVDRFKGYVSGGGAFTTERLGGNYLSNEFEYCLKAISTTANASRDAVDYSYLEHDIEGFNSAYLMYGTADSRVATLSFVARASLTGTYAVALVNSAADRSIVKEYTLVADTPTLISLSFDGDTTGTWLTDNGIGLRVRWDLGSGSTAQGAVDTWSANNYYASNTPNADWMGETAGATFYLTGVQFHLGNTPLAFEPRAYSEELRMCHRYYERRDAGEIYNVFAYGALDGNGTIANTLFTYVEKRAKPTTATVSNCTILDQTDRKTATYSAGYFGLSSATLMLSCTAMTSYNPAALDAAGSSAYVAISAEL